MSSTFGMPIDFDFLKRVPSLHLRPEVDLRRHGRCLRNRYDIITLPWVDQLGWSFVHRCNLPCRQWWQKKGPAEKWTPLLVQCVFLVTMEAWSPFFHC